MMYLYTKYVLLLLILGGGILSTSALGEKQDEDAFAVIELFTSQGCSSCPPADKLLAEMVHTSRQRNQRILGLSFHVSYWNYLGWRDPYSSPEFTARQKKYAATLGEGVYTPQMIVNGKDVFVGSDRTQAHKSLKKAFSRTAQMRTHVIKNIQADQRENQLHVRCEVQGEASGKEIHAAWVERNIETAVKRGENSGRKLHHANVVRKFRTKKLREINEFLLEIPREIRWQNTSILLYIQDSKTLEILAGKRHELTDVRISTPYE